MEQQKRAYMYAAVVVLLWSTVASAFKISLRYIEPISLLLYASSVSLIVVGLDLVVEGKAHLLRRTAPKEVIQSALLGLLNPFLYYLVLFHAYSLLPAQEAQPLNQVWGIIIPLMSIAVLGQPIGWKNIVALFLGFLGVVVISTHGNPLALAFTSPLGVVLAVGSAFIWSAFWVYNVRDTRDESVKLFLNFTFGLIFIAIASGALHILPLSGVSALGLGGAVYIGLFEMGLTYILWLKALQTSENTAQVSILVYFVPFISLVFIHYTVGEAILPSTLAGLGLIVMAIMLQHFWKGGEASPGEG